MCGKWVLSPWPRAERKLPGGRRRVDEVRVDAYKRPSQKSKFTLRTKAGWDLAAGFQVEFSTTPPAGGVCYNQVARENLHQLNHLTTARALRAAAGVPAGPAPRADGSVGRLSGPNGGRCAVVVRSASGAVLVYYLDPLGRCPDW